MSKKDKEVKWIQNQKDTALFEFLEAKKYLKLGHSKIR